MGEGAVFLGQFLSLNQALPIERAEGEGLAVLHDHLRAEGLLCQATGLVGHAHLVDGPELDLVHLAAGIHRELLALEDEGNRSAEGLGAVGIGLGHAASYPRIIGSANDPTLSNEVYRTNSRIAWSMPSRLSGYIRSPKSCRIREMEWV